ncbi:MAG TPA: hypothetical protein VF297_28020 [Pyrinomonadaceae bacterium]
MARVLSGFLDFLVIGTNAPVAELRTLAALKWCAATPDLQG